MYGMKRDLAQAFDELGLEVPFAERLEAEEAFDAEAALRAFGETPFADEALEPYHQEAADDEWLEMADQEADEPERFGEFGDERDTEWESDEFDGERESLDQYDEAAAFEDEMEEEAGLSASGLTPAEQKAVEITSTFETGKRGGFYGLSGNFDGQGLSFGLVNWTMGTGSLQPLLRDFAAKHSARWTSVFGANAARFLQLVSRKGKDAIKEQHRFAIEQMNDCSIRKGKRIWSVREPWVNYFKRLSEDPAFRNIQIYYVRDLLARAEYYCQYFKLKSEQAFAFMFDAVSSHGKWWLTKKLGGKQKRRMLVEDRMKALVDQHGEGTVPEIEILLAIADVLGATSAPRWAKKVRQRKRWFVTGEHPRARELRGLRPRPDTPYSASAGNRKAGETAEDAEFWVGARNDPEGKLDEADVAFSLGEGEAEAGERWDSEALAWRDFESQGAITEWLEPPITEAEWSEGEDLDAGTSGKEPEGEELETFEEFDALEDSTQQSEETPASDAALGAEAWPEFEWEEPGCAGEQASLDVDAEWFDSEMWTHSADQIAFRDLVLETHLKLSKKAKGPPKRDLPDDALKNVPETDIKTLPDTAAAAGRLLAAAKADLAQAQQAGHADALRTTGLSVISGYRGSTHQRTLWIRYFSTKGGYYDRTQAAREKCPDGPHSCQAVAYMLKPEEDGGFGLMGKIAAPGYSNHQGGIAVDFWQERRKGHFIGNKTDISSRAKWRDTWFHAWLKANAATYEFKPIRTEEWHWEYRPGATAVTPRRSATRPARVSALANEQVRFAQRVLNTTEGERLNDDGDLGRRTRTALERFRAKYGLGRGGVLDGKTELALAQRALEELAQASMFAQVGQRDAKTDQALAAFKSSRGLGIDATLDAATRHALTDALARRAFPSGAAGGGSVSDYLGGKLWTFTTKTLNTRVAAFCPKAALSPAEVEVLVFAHGLLGGCPRPKQIPAGFITDAPFHLGRIVDASGRPMALVVPFLDWSKPGGEHAFGRGRERWHALAKPGNLNAVIAEVLAELGRVRSGPTPSMRGLILAGHSRAYDFLEPLAYSSADPQMRQGALAKLSQVWSLDATYAGNVAKWKSWLDANPNLRVSIFYEPGTKTGSVGDEFYRKRGSRLAVTHVHEGHCAVPAKRLPELLRPSVPPTTEAEWSEGENLDAGWSEAISGEVPEGDELKEFDALEDANGAKAQQSEGTPAYEGAEDEWLENRAMESEVGTAAKPAPIQARILWPALGFPAVVSHNERPSGNPGGGDATTCICVLVATSSPRLSSADAARCLRYVPWAQRGKRYIAARAFEPSDIAVRCDAGTTALTLAGRNDRFGAHVAFGANTAKQHGIVALLAEPVRAFYKNVGLPHLYEIRVSEAATAGLRQGQYHLFWNNLDANEYAPSDEMKLLVERFAVPRRAKLGKAWDSRRDFLLAEYMYEYGDLHAPYNRNRTRARVRAEILHPLFILPRSSKPLTIGHVTDTHVDVRADVYEHNLKVALKAARTKPGHVLNKVDFDVDVDYNNFNTSFAKVYREARTSDIDILLMTGDLIDYGRGFWGLERATYVQQDGLYHCDRNWFLFYDLIAAGDAYSTATYTILGNHDWRLNPYPPFAPGAPNPNELINNHMGLTRGEQHNVIAAAHGDGHKRGFSYSVEAEKDYQLLLDLAPGDIVKGLVQLFGRTGPAEQRGFPTETSFEFDRVVFALDQPVPRLFVHAAGQAKRPHARLGQGRTRAVPDRQERRGERLRPVDGERREGDAEAPL